MPRSGRGGKRTGKPGTAYSNRSDLTQAASAAPGQGYGVQAQQLRAQATAPLPKQAPPPVPAQGGSGTPGPPPGVSAPMPGALGALDAPSARPNEPITAGLNSGPGPGPEALTAPDPLVNAAAVLNNLGANTDPQTEILRARVNAMLGNQGTA